MKKYKTRPSIMTRQNMILFFLQIVVTMIHNAFAFLTWYQLGQKTNRKMSAIQSIIVILVRLICMQIIYFLIIRFHYIKRIYTKLYSKKDNPQNESVYVVNRPWIPGYNLMLIIIRSNNLSRIVYKNY